MKNKLIIEGKEFDLPQSLVDEIKEKLSPKPNIQIVKKLTYDDVTNELFKKEFWYIGDGAETRNTLTELKYVKSGWNVAGNEAISKKQLEKLLAINKIMNVAKYLNKKEILIENYKLLHYLFINSDDRVDVTRTETYNSNMNIYFESRKLAVQAISILGEDVIKLALSTNY